VGSGAKKSIATFGGYDAAKYGNGNVTWHNVSSEYYWSVKLTEVKIRNESLTKSVSNVIIDSGTSFLLLPSNDFKVLTQKLSVGQSCGISEEFNGLFTCQCSPDQYKNYPPLKLHFDGIEYLIPKENYITYIDGYCMYRIMYMYFPPQMDKFWVMGLTFFHNYYAIFDA